MRCILGIETSCDETSVAVIVHDKKNSRIKILSNIVETQIESHQPFGGVVPEVAARDHLAKIHSVTQKAIVNANINIKDIDSIAVTMGPGLIGALMVGILYARGLAISSNKPLIAINHVDAHLSPALFVDTFTLNDWIIQPNIKYPALSLTVSGGHCHLSILESANQRIILGKTSDDACGEAFDKSAKLLGFPYPGGPWIEKIASSVTSSNYKFNHSIQDKTNRYGFSFSGLKTALLMTVKKEMHNQTSKKISGSSLSDQIKSELCYAFQEASLGQLIERVQNAIQDFPQIKTVLVAGGVAANKKFREKLSMLPKPIHCAPPALCSDNGTMIALHAILEDRNGFDIQPFSKYF